MSFVSSVPLGAAVRWDRVRDSPGYARFYLAHYSWLTPENELKMNALETDSGRFDFSTADAFVDWARRHRKSVHGHVLVWGQQLPGWLTPTDGSAPPTAKALRRILGDYINAVLHHFRGRIKEWDVVNEAFNPNGSWNRNLWYRGLGPRYIETAFRIARAADPHVRLCYNDLGIETPGPHQAAAMRLVRALRRQRLLDCIGLEAHTSPGGTSQRVMSQALRRFASTGAQVLISELDVTLSGTGGSEAQRRVAQARAYRDVALACRSVSRCARVTTWGFTDASSWLGDSAQALPFDSACRPKPAWSALKTALAR